jgi:hypothetical protein
MGCNLPRSLLANLPSPPRKIGNGAATVERGERRGGILPQVKPPLPLPFHRSGHGNVEIGINSMPGLDMKNHAHIDC